jgi:rod shape-determining protein MreD
MRSGGIFALGWLLLAIQSAVLWSLPGVPDFLVPLALYLGATRKPLRAALLAGAMGYLADLLGGGPRGLQIMIGMVVSYVASALSVRFVVRGPIFLSLLAFFSSILAQLVALGMLSAFYRGFHYHELLLGDLLPVALATALATPLVVWLCAWLDRLGRKARTEERLLSL